MFRAQLFHDEGSKFGQRQMQESGATGGHGDMADWQVLCENIWKKMQALLGSDSNDDMGGSGTETAAGGASSRGDRGSSKTDEKLKSLFSEKMHDIQNYLNELKKQVEYYHDAASGKEMRVEEESIPLEAVPSKSTASLLEADSKAVQKDMICPITHSLMHDPVRCFPRETFRTYERSAIEEYFQTQIARQEQDKRANVLDPMSRLELQTK